MDKMNERDKAIAELIAAGAAWAPFWRHITHGNYKQYTAAGNRLATAVEKLKLLEKRC